MRLMMNRALCTGTAAALCMLAGCVAPANDRLAINNIETLDTDGGVQTPATEYHSLQTVGRREWAPLTYTMPVDSVVHSPTYASTVEITDELARQRGAFPTLESAYETGSSDYNQQIHEALIAPGVAFVQGFASMVLVFVDQPTDGDESPQMAYQRSGVKATLRPAINELPAVTTEEDDSGS